MEIILDSKVNLIKRYGTILKLGIGYGFYFLYKWGV